MTIGSLTRTLLHRWYLTVVVLALVAYLARGAWDRAEPEYQTSATFLVTPSVALSTPLPEAVPGTQPGSRNPFSLSGGASTLAATVSTALNTGTVQAGFMAPFPGAQFAAAEASGTTGNRTYFTVTAATDTPEEGAAVIDAALRAAAQQLLDVQRAVQAPDNGLFVVIQSTPTDGPVESYPDRARAVGTIGLGGLAAGVVLIVALDALLSALGRGLSARRTRRRGATGTPAGAATTTGAGTTTGTTTGTTGTGAGTDALPSATRAGDLDVRGTSAERHHQHAGSSRSRQP
ncbi:hypothetical protein [Kineococcus aurantiacus]|uniref:Capsular polysaccharide biosynthesis protein n=1 Tax=Kineococcus aurantiacus TaxID=37633 RepID=A0A7Y9AUA6_9ACTN|nr:hypothetical protein [Kineococcus aurantiacus]NYD21548.1 hypothetical protein [Kineococcus aurantiacus]